jgi:hypothetical protein
MRRPGQTGGTVKGTWHQPPKHLHSPAPACLVRAPRGGRFCGSRAGQRDRATTGRSRRLACRATAGWLDRPRRQPIESAPATRRWPGPPCCGPRAQAPRADIHRQLQGASVRGRDRSGRASSIAQRTALRGRPRLRTRQPPPGLAVRSGTAQRRARRRAPARLPRVRRRWLGPSPGDSALRGSRSFGLAANRCPRWTVHQSDSGRAARRLTFARASECLTSRRPPPALSRPELVAEECSPAHPGRVATPSQCWSR